jgi:hypothetical protein
LSFVFKWLRDSRENVALQLVTDFSATVSRIDTDFLPFPPVSIIDQEGVHPMGKKKFSTEASPKTFAEVIDVIQATDDISKTRRRDLVSALRSMARFLDTDVGLVLANTEWLRQRLRQIHPRQIRVSDKHFQNVKSAVMAALRLTVSNNKRHAAFADMNADYEALYQAIPDRMTGYKLSRFFRYCSEQDILPADITNVTVEAFEADVVAGTLHKNPGKVACEAVLTWNKMRNIVPGWPKQELVRKGGRQPWTIPLEQFPATFLQDIETWLGRLGASDLFDENAPVRACRPATIEHRRFQIRMMASAIVRSGVSIDDITSLDDLVRIDNFRAGMQFMLDRHDGDVREADFTLASGIKAIARHHVKVRDDHLKQLQGICSRLDQKADRHRKKNRDRLSQFGDARNLALLLALPARLARLSGKPGPKPRSAALYMQTAVAVEILLHCPMRIGNLVSLDMGLHLRWIGDGKSLRLVIDIPGNEVKNDKPLRYELTGGSAMLVRDYVDRIRPGLTPEPTSAVFPGMNGAPRRAAALSEQISRHCLEQTGLVINAHLFRSLAGKIHNLVSAGDAATISHVLGDTIGTVARSYIQFEQKAALDHYQRSVRLVRQGNDNDPDEEDDAA